MQQRQLRLGDILDDYCPRERRVTNHAVVAMIGSDVKQTRCTTCDAEHEYKHAKIPRQRKKVDTPVALHPANAASGPKRVSHDGLAPNAPEATTTDVPGNPGTPGNIDNPENPTVSDAAVGEGVSTPIAARKDDESAGLEVDALVSDGDAESDEALSDEDEQGRGDEGPVHRPLIRASLPRPEGQQPPARPIPEFTIRQPGGRQNRFRPRHHHGGGQQFQGNRSNGNLAGGPSRGPRPGGAGRPPIASRLPKRQGPDGQRRKRSK